MYFKTANRLAEAITKGLPSEFAYDNPANLLSAQLKANLYQFSGAKSLTESLLFAEQVMDKEGKLKPFSKYKDDVKKIHKDYNVRYLSAEYDNTLAQAQMAIKWKNFEELGVEYLEYRTAGDDRVRREHEDFNNLILETNAPFWSRAYPPNDWGCRCTVVPAEKPDKPTDIKKAGRLAKENITNPVFENNVGKTGLVYKNNHPYYKSLDGKLNELDAIKNYGMKPVGKILEQSNLPAAIHLDTKENWLEWWQDMVKEHGVNDTDFVLKDRFGTKILFNSTNGKKKGKYFRDHILEEADQKRFEYAANLKDIIEQPDEIWFKYYKGNIPTYNYIKYYDGQAIVISTKVEETVNAKTIYTIDEPVSMKINRKGVLMYKK